MKLKAFAVATVLFVVLCSQTFGSVGTSDSITISPETGFNVMPTNLADRQKIKTVKILEGVPELPTFAFANCAGLRKVELPQTVSSIGEFAFAGCAELRAVTIPSFVRSIGSNAFADCPKLKMIGVEIGFTSHVQQLLLQAGLDVSTVRFAESCSPLSLYAVTFEPGTHCEGIDGDLLQIVLNGCAAVAPSVYPHYGWRFDGWDKDLSCVTNDLTVTAQYSEWLPDGYYVRTVGGVEWHFFIRNGEVSVENQYYSAAAIPDSTAGTLTIPSAFGGCPVTGIGDYAFCRCASLESVEIPSTVTSIGRLAFGDCQELGSVMIPSSVTNVEEGAFVNCSKLAEISVADGNVAYRSIDGVLYDKAGTVLIQCPGGKVGAVTMPETVTSVEWGAFVSCSKLSAINVADGNVAYSSRNGLLCNREGIELILCPSGKSGSLEIPSGLKHVRAGAFNNCVGITSLVIPSSVTDIGEYAFGGCVGLVEVSIPTSVTSIGDGAFFGCNGLKTIRVAKGDKERVRGLLSTSGFDTSSVQFAEEGNRIVVECGSADCFEGEEVEFEIKLEDADGEPIVNAQSDLFIYLQSETEADGECVYARNLACPGAWGVMLPWFETSASFFVDLLDGDESNAGRQLAFNVVLLDCPQWPSTAAEVERHRVRAYQTGEPLVLSVHNVIPCVERVRVKNAVSGMWLSKQLPAGVPVTFFASIAEPGRIDRTVEEGDQGDRRFQVRWTVTDVNGIVTDQFVARGDPDDLGNAATFTFLTPGTYAMHVDLRDKDMLEFGNGDYNETFDFEIEVVGPPSITIEHDGVYWEADAGDAGGMASMHVILGTNNYRVPLTVNLLIAPIDDASDNPGLLKLRTDDTVLYKGEVERGGRVYDSYDVVFQNPRRLEIPILIERMDGTDTSSETGFEIIPSMVSEDIDPLSGKPANECFVGEAPEALKIINVEPMIDDVYPSSYGVIAATADLMDEAVVWRFDDVAPDFERGITVEIEGGGGWGPKTYTSREEAENDGRIGFRPDFSGMTGNQLVRLVVTDSDGGCSEATWSYRIEKQETVGDRTFLYMIENGEATIVRAAIPSCQTGQFEIPATLGECPVTSVGDYAIEGCSELVSLGIPNSVTNIGRGAFCGCSGLKTIRVAESNPAYSSADGLLLDRMKATLVACPCGLKSVTIPTGVTRIGEFAFGWCENLRSVDIPMTVTSIGSFAFCGCEGLTTLTIPPSVTNVGEYAFDGCFALDTVTIPACLCETRNGFPDAFGSAKSDLAVIIGEGVANIGDGAFRSCRGVVSVSIPSSVTNIGESAFANCTSLKSVTIPQGVMSIGRSAFERCTMLASVSIPSSVRRIGMDVFSYCYRLASVTIAEGVTDIGWGMFEECGGLTSVTIPSSVTSIGDGAFRGCSGLTALTFPPSLKSIGSDAFRNCRDLAMITIPSSVESIGTWAFYGCDSLVAVRVNRSVDVDSVRTMLSGSGFDVAGLTFVNGEEPVPDIGTEEDPAVVKAALQGAADPRLSANIADATTYGDYREWALKVGAAEVTASPNAWVSFATDSAVLLTKMPTDEDLKVEEFKPSATAGSFDFTVSVEDVKIGDKASEDNLKKLFGLEGAESLDAAAFSTENVALQFKGPQGGNLKFTATPAVDDAKSFFMKVKVK